MTSLTRSMSVRISWKDCMEEMSDCAGEANMPMRLCIV